MFEIERVRVHGSYFDVGMASKYLFDATKHRVDAEVIMDAQMEQATDVDIRFKGFIFSRLLAYLRYRRALVKLRREGVNVERMWGF